jgi:hypothetical protein
LNNWRAVGYIFLGFGSVFLSYALIVTLSMMFSGLPILNQVPVALAVNAQWLVLSALMYVVGFVGYYAGQEKVATPIPSKRKRQSVSNKIDSLWSFPIGALTALGVLVLQGALGFWNDSDLIYGVALPIFYSIVAGSIVGIVAYLIIPHIN